MRPEMDRAPGTEPKGTAIAIGSSLTTIRRGLTEFQTLEKRSASFSRPACESRSDSPSSQITSATSATVRRLSSRLCESSTGADTRS